jgi:hypothetical protein
MRKLRHREVKNFPKTTNFVKNKLRSKPGESDFRDLHYYRSIIHHNTNIVIQCPNSKIYDCCNSSNSAFCFVSFLGVRGVWIQGFALARQVLYAWAIFPALVFLFFAVLRFELRTYILRHTTSAFLWWVFEIGSWELFANFKLQSSWSLPPE